MTPSTGGFPVPVNRTAAVGVPQQFYLFDELAGVARSAGLDGRYISAPLIGISVCRLTSGATAPRSTRRCVMVSGLAVAARRECGPITGLAPAAVLVVSDALTRKLKRARWSYAEDRRLLELAASSKSVEEVAHLMRRSPAAVYKMTVRLGAPLSPMKLGLKAKK